MKKEKKLSLRRILVPMDFSRNARQALRYAAALAAQFGGRITLLHIVQPVVYPTEMAITVANEKIFAGAAQKHLSMLSEKFIPEKLRGKVLVRTGQPDYQIAEVARELKTDLIVQTTHGYTGIKRILLGGTAEHVIRHAPCPTLTVRVR